MPKSSLHFVFGRSLSYYNIKKHLLEIYWIWFWLSLCPSEYSLRYNINMRNFANFILIIIYKDIIYLNQILCHDQYLKSTILFTVSLHHIDNSTLRLFHVPDSVTVLLVHLSACCVSVSFLAKFVYKLKFISALQTVEPADKIHYTSTENLIISYVNYIVV